MRFSPLAWCALSFVLVGSVACDEIFGDGDDDQAPQRPIAVLNDNNENSSFVQVLTTELETVGTDPTLRATFTLGNQGTGPLLINAIRFASDPVLCPSPSPLFRLEGTTPTILQPQFSVNIEVVFDGLFVDTGCSMLEVITSDSTRQVIRAHLIARREPQIHLCIDGGPVDFGVLTSGSTARAAITLRPCEGFPSTSIDALTTDTAFPYPFKILNPPALPLELVAGEQLVVDVEFAPLGPGQPYFGVLTFEADAGFVAATSFSGTAVTSPDCQPVIEPDSVSFPTTPTGATPSTPVLIRNIGTTACAFNGASGSGTGGFIVDETSFPIGTELQPGAQRGVQLTWRPTVAGSASDDFSFTFNSNVVRTLHVEGEAVARDQCMLVMTDVFAPLDVSPGIAFEKAITFAKDGPQGCTIAVGRPQLVDDNGLYAVVGADDDALGEDVAVDAPFREGHLITDLAGAYSIQIQRRPGFGAGVSVDTLEVPWFVVGDDVQQVLRIPLRSRATPPCFTVSATEIDFGPNIGRQNRFIQVVNCGRPFQLSRLDFVGLRDPRLTLASRDIGSTIVSGSGVGFTVFFEDIVVSPPFDSFTSGTIEIGIDNEVVSLPIRGSAGATCQTDIVCQPDLSGTGRHFGRVAVGESSQLAFICENRARATGNATIDVVEDGPFGGVGTTVLAPGTSASIRLTFTPTAAGVATTDLVLSDDACGGAPVVVRVDGEGFDREEPTCVEAVADAQVQNLVTLRTSHVWATPVVTQMFGTAAVVLVEFPQIFDAAGIGDLRSPVIGTVRAVTGGTGAALWNAFDSVLAATTPAVADLDGDGSPETIAVALQPGLGVGLSPPRGLHTRGQLLAYDTFGRVVWRSANWTIARAGFEDAGAVAVGDVDGDGRTEVAFGDTVFNHDGTLRWHGQGHLIGSAGRGPRSFFADVVGDEGLELVVGPRLYDGDTGSIVRDGSGEDGLAALGDVDGDGRDELIVRGTMLRVFSIGDAGLEQRGASLVPPTRLEMGATCAPLDDAACAPLLRAPVAIAPIDDVAGDEIVVTSGGLVLVYGFVGNAFVELRRIALGDTAGAVPPTTIDVDGDGRHEILVGDGAGYRLFEGSTARLSVALPATPLLGGLVVSDIDADGDTEILRTNGQPFQQGTPVSLDVATSTTLPRVDALANQATPSAPFTATGASLFGRPLVDATVPSRAVVGICER